MARRRLDSTARIAQHRVNEQRVRPMNVDGEHMRTIWLAEDGWSVEVIDQTRLPHDFVVRRLTSADAGVQAIAGMVVRGAPLIGATAAYALALAMHADAGDENLDQTAEALLASRPTAINLRRVVDALRARLRALPIEERARSAYDHAARICDEDVAINEAIGRHGLRLLRDCLESKRHVAPVNVLTHCNAGWLATVDWGTALAPVYMAHDAGVPVHVWVDETRPRNQGASLTAWELARHGVPHTLVVDNAGGHLMQRGMVDLLLTGTDRTTASGDVCNKIGTYLQALAARDNGVPFYVALPGPSIDWHIAYGVDRIPIEERDEREITEIAGKASSGEIVTVRLAPRATRARNYAFDVTPAHLVTGLVTERGICEASTEGLLSLYPERRENRAAG